MNGDIRKSDRILAIGVAALLVAAVPIGALGLLGLQHAADGLRAEAVSQTAQSDAARKTASDLAQNRWDFALQAGGVGVALAGAALAALAAWGAPRRRWPLAAAAAAVVYLLLDAAPAASSLVSFFYTLVRHVGDSSQAVVTAALEPLAITRFAMAVLAAGLYLAIAWRLAPRMFYGLTCGSLGAAAVFFNLWSPPPPKPVPILHPLAQTWHDAAGRSHTMADDLLAAMPPGWTGRHVPMDKRDEQLVGADDYLNLIMQSPDKQYAVEVYITYNADAMSNIPHVPWVCMVQGGAFELAAPKRVDDTAIREIPGSFPGREVPANVLLFQPGVGHSGPNIFMFQYFNAGRNYEHDRDVARAIAAAGSHSQAGSFISQTQIRVVLPRGAGGDAMDRHSMAYGLGLRIMNLVVPLLEKDYYPDLSGPGATVAEPLAAVRGSEGG
jgi:hypothetical protein